MLIRDTIAFTRARPCTRSRVGFMRAVIGISRVFWPGHFLGVAGGSREGLIAGTAVAQ